MLSPTLLRYACSEPPSTGTCGERSAASARVVMATDATSAASSTLIVVAVRFIWGILLMLDGVYQTELAAEFGGSKVTPRAPRCDCKVHGRGSPPMFPA